MRSNESESPELEGSEPLSWLWVAGGVLLGAGLISLFMLAVDPDFQRPAVTVLMVTLSLVVVGILVGYRSRGETIRETAIVGVILVLVSAGFAVGVLGVRLPAIIWLLGPFYAASLAMAGGWVGEMLQGTLEEAHEDRPIDWPWVFVSVVIGFTLGSYLAFLGSEVLNLTPIQVLAVFAGSFLVTGWIVGFFSPGVTMVEPAIAAGGMVVLDAALVIIWFESLPVTAILIGFAGGVLLALGGGWLGEKTQRRRSVESAS